MANTYINTLNQEIQEYFKILSPEFPSWLTEYIETPEMQRIDKISIFCGTDYTKLFNNLFWYSNLAHSIGVALIIWNFTHDKKQTLSGLFHDIATPTFKHCIDFMNGDSEYQESTEDRTENIIRSSKELMSLLKRDNIKVEEVSDYHIYPIADNNTPQLSADRFEYTFSNGLSFHRIWNLDEIKKFYNDICILKNENGVSELGFKTPQICEKYVSKISKLWPEWISPRDRISMQFLADIVKSMNVKNYISIDDLYKYSEKEIIEKILNCEDKYISDSFKKFQETTKCYTSEKNDSTNYSITTKGKKRYIIPLVKANNSTVRITEISNTAQNAINTYLSYKQPTYVSFDFEFKPYEF